MTDTSAERNFHGMLGSIIKDGNIFSGKVDAVDLNALHSTAHPIRVLDDDVVRGP